MKLHLENVEELKYFLYPVKDIMDFLNKLIKIELKMQLYEDKQRINIKDEILGREIIGLCRTVLLDTLLWARVVLPLSRFKDYKDRVDRIINEIDKGTKPSPDWAYQVYLMTAQNIIDAVRFTKTKLYPFIIRNIVDNLDSSLVRKEKEEVEGIKIRKRI